MLVYSKGAKGPQRRESRQRNTSAFFFLSLKKRFTCNIKGGLVNEMCNIKIKKHHRTKIRNSHCIIQKKKIEALSVSCGRSCKETIQMSRPLMGVSYRGDLRKTQEHLDGEERLTTYKLTNGRRISISHVKMAA